MFDTLKGLWIANREAIWTSVKITTDRLRYARLDVFGLQKRKHKLTYLISLQYF